MVLAIPYVGNEVQKAMLAIFLFTDHYEPFKLFLFTNNFIGGKCKDIYLLILGL